MNNEFFKKLNHEDVLVFRKFSRENYVLGDDIPRLWHPVTRLECELMNAEVVLSPDVELKLETIDKPQYRLSVRCPLCAYELNVVIEPQDISCPNCDAELHINTFNGADMTIEVINEE